MIVAVDNDTTGGVLHVIITAARRVCNARAAERTKTTNVYKGLPWMV
jgi:hypothetical protein